MSERRSIVVTYRQGFRYWLYGLIVLVSLVSVMTGILWERHKGSQILDEKNDLADEVSALQDLVKFKTTELDMIRVNGDVDTAALENARQEMMGLQAQIYQDQEQLQLYRELLEDTDPPGGLSVSRFQLTLVDSKNIAYRWVARQKTVKMQVTTILVDIQVMGSQGNKPVSLSLSELDTEVKVMPLTIKFKYFSINQGVLSLPDGFNPDTVQISLGYSWSDKLSYQQTFDWKVEE
ncbi:MAG: hypothetical protein ACI89A_000682 [Porticoccaceae bacterium]|jgi:hypothetical protein